MHSPEETAGVFDSEGFMRTGDAASLDEDNDPNIPAPSGFLKITGRLKEILITAGGENIAPLVIEFTMKTHIPAISNCIVVGDQRKYLTMLITLKCEIDVATNTPTDKLVDDSLLVSKQIGSNAVTVSEAIKDPKWHEYLKQGLERGNVHAVSHAQRVQKYRILPADLSESHGFLTPTMKVKRKVVLEKFEHLINDMYNEE
jgi:long-chain-fatty-acid--CoA ligase ACSBG